MDNKRKLKVTNCLSKKRKKKIQQSKKISYDLLNKLNNLQ